MSIFSDYIKGMFGDKYIVKEELNYDPSEDTIIIRSLQGTNFKGSTVQPIQLEVYTDNTNEAMRDMSLFATTSTSEVITGGLTYIKMAFGTPQVFNVFVAQGTQQVSTVVLNGTLIISSDIQDVKDVIIDGNSVHFDQITDSYSALEDNVKLYDDIFPNTRITAAINKITLNTISKNSPLMAKIRNIRKGLLAPDVLFNIKLIYLDETELEFTMKLGSYATIVSGSNIPSATVVFTQ